MIYLKLAKATAAGIAFYCSFSIAAAITTPPKTRVTAPGAKVSATPTAKTTSAAKPAAPSALVVAGAKVYDANGCSGCHTIGGQGGTGGPDLTRTGADPKHTLQWLEVQVTNPKAHSPNATMPAFPQVKGKDLIAIGTYLSSLKGAPQAATAPVSKGPDAATTAIITQITKEGASVQQIAQNDDHLDVSFHLAGAPINDASLEPLKHLKKVSRLDLGSTSVTDAGLATIQGFTDLTDLHLENTKITDNGLEKLKGLRSLAYLNLYGTAVTDAGLDSLAGLSNLKHLYVWQTKITEDGAKKLKKSIPGVDIVLGPDSEVK